MNTQVKLNIKLKLMEQLDVLEIIQATASRNGDYRLAYEMSDSILELAQEINDYDEPFICQAREEAKLQATLITDIANKAGVSTLIVKMVLDAQSVVLEID